MAGECSHFDLERFGFADDVAWLPSPERARIEAPTVSLRIMATGAWILATAVSLLAVGFIPPSRRQRGKQSDLRRRMLRAAVRRWLGPAAVRARDAGELADLEDGALVRIEGTVRGRAAGRRKASPFERLALTIELGSEEHARLYHLVRDRAVDFDVVDSQGSPIHIQVAGARLIGPPIRERARPTETLRQLAPAAWPPPLDERWSMSRRLTMGAYHLSDGDRVEIYGTKDRVIDRSLTQRLARQDPIGLALRSGASAPLVILTRDRRKGR